ncbi:hypothetical protein [Vannielia litorea]|uniref:hypothetical protein n=1 Tax=Vannielia litorea TaxID=1217970 RepID=UPI001BCEA0F6|nr:hypothetical protein [Vannielia litorea]MBS8228668.1 hypothetical protein [Vannielia litorea]
MDWAIVLSMPLMLLIGFIGDALGREEDEDQGVSQATSGAPDIDGSGAEEAVDDGLSAMLEASEEEAEETPSPEVTTDQAARDATPDAPGETATVEGEDAPEEVETASAVKPSVMDEVEPEPEEAPSEDEAEEALAEDGREEIDDFDPEEDVLMVEAPGASEATPEVEETEGGLLVRMAGQETFLRGVTELPEDAVVGVEPSPST